MTKYIDTDILRKEIEKKSHEEQGFSSGDSEYGYRSCARDLLAFIDYLQQEQPEVDLDEAAEEFAKDAYPDKHNLVWMFKRGAGWQKTQMMKEAVEGEICGRVYDHINVRFADGVCKYLEPKNISHIPADVSKYNIGDKVRIIIVKKEENK